MSGLKGNIRTKNIRKGFEKNWNRCDEALRRILVPGRPRFSRRRLAYNATRNSYIKGE